MLIAGNSSDEVRSLVAVEETRQQVRTRDLGVTECFAHAARDRVADALRVATWIGERMTQMGENACRERSRSSRAGAPTSRRIAWTCGDFG